MKKCDKIRKKNTLRAILSLFQVSVKESFPFTKRVKLEDFKYILKQMQFFFLYGQKTAHGQTIQKNPILKSFHVQLFKTNRMKRIQNSTKDLRSLVTHFRHNSLESFVKTHNPKRLMKFNFLHTAPSPTKVLFHKLPLRMRNIFYSQRLNIRF